MSTVTAATLRSLLEKSTLRTQTEALLQEDVEAALRSEGIAFTREVRLTPTDRVDFLVGSVAVELKTKGARNAVLAQLIRYAQSDRVEDILLVTTRYAHCQMPPELNGKRVLVALIQRGLA